MKTATVRDLRNRYTSLLDWIEAGEEILITQRGKVVARLVPERGSGEGEVDWTQSPAIRRNRKDAITLTAEQSREILQEAAGTW